MIVPELAILSGFGTESRNDIGLAHASVAHDDNLHHIVVDITFLELLQVFLKVLEPPVVQTHSELSLHILWNIKIRQ